MKKSTNLKADIPPVPPLPSIPESLRSTLTPKILDKVVRRMRSRSELNPVNPDSAKIPTPSGDISRSKKKQRKTKAKKPLKAGISPPELQANPQGRSSMETLLSHENAGQEWGKVDARPRAGSRASSKTSVDARPLVYTVALPRLSPMEYTRMYLLNKAKKEADKNHELVKPLYKWFWTPNWESFLIIPRVSKMASHQDHQGMPKPRATMAEMKNPVSVVHDSLVAIKDVNSATSHPRLSFNLRNMSTLISEVTMLASLNTDPRAQMESPQTKPLSQSIENVKYIGPIEDGDEVRVRLPSGSFRDPGTKAGLFHSESCSELDSNVSMSPQNASLMFTNESIGRSPRRFSSPQSPAVFDMRLWSKVDPSEKSISGDLLDSIAIQRKLHSVTGNQLDHANRNVQMVSGMRHSSLQASLYQQRSSKATESPVFEMKESTSTNYFDEDMPHSPVPARQHVSHRGVNTERHEFGTWHDAKRVSRTTTTPLKRQSPRLQYSPSTPEMKKFISSGNGPSGFTPTRSVHRSNRRGTFNSNISNKPSSTPVRNDDAQVYDRMSTGTKSSLLSDRQPTPYKCRMGGKEIDEGLPSVPDIVQSKLRVSPLRTISRTKNDRPACVVSTFELQASKASSSATILPELDAVAWNSPAAKTKATKASRLPVSKSSRYLSRSGVTTPVSTLRNISALPDSPDATFSTLFRKRSHLGLRVMNSPAPRVPTTPTMHWRPFDEHQEPLSPWHYQDNSYNASPKPRRGKRSSSRRER